MCAEQADKGQGEPGPGQDAVQPEAAKQPETEPCAAAEAPGIRACRAAVAALQEEQAAQGRSRELALAITNAQQALMWRCQAP